MSFRRSAESSATQARRGGARAEGEGFATPDEARSIGWDVSAPFPRLALNSRGGENWRATRLWSSAGTFTGRPLRTGITRAFVGVDGEGTVHSAAGSVTIPPFTIVALPGDTAIETTQSVPWARLIWEVDYPALHLPRFSAAFAEALNLEGHLWHLIAAITNVLTPSGDRKQSEEDPYLAETLGATLAAALASSATPITTSRSTLYADARRIIDEKHRDSALSVTSLAQRLSISIPHIHRLFAHAGATPRDAIEERRVSTARALLALADGHMDEKDIAARSGFTSVRRMRDAFQRQSPTGPDVQQHHTPSNGIR